MEKQQINIIENILGYSFKDTKYIERAFIHASYANQNDVKSYERLEFFGDSILGFIITEAICFKYLDITQGELTSLKKTLVSTSPLSKIMRKLGLDQFIKVAKATNVTDKICEDVFEAIVAAIYLDSNIESAKNFVLKQYDEDILKLENKNTFDYKSKLLEEYGPQNVQFKTIKKSGADHNPVFTIALFINGEEKVRAKANKKLLAEQICSKEFLNNN